MEQLKASQKDAQNLHRQITAQAKQHQEQLGLKDKQLLQACQEKQKMQGELAKLSHEIASVRVELEKCSKDKQQLAAQQCHSTEDLKSRVQSLTSQLEKALQEATDSKLQNAKLAAQLRDTQNKLHSSDKSAQASLAKMQN